MATIFGHAYGPTPDLFGPIFGPVDAGGGGAVIHVRNASGTLTTAPRATATLSKIGGVMNELYRGESTTLPLVIKVDGVAAAIDAGDHQVSEIEYTLRRGNLEDAGSVALTKTLTGGGIELDASVTGGANIDLNTEDTNDLVPGLYYEQVMVVFADDPDEYVFVIPPRRRIVYGAVRVP